MSSSSISGIWVKPTSVGVLSDVNQRVTMNSLPWNIPYKLMGPIKPWNLNPWDNLMICVKYKHMNSHIYILYSYIYIMYKSSIPYHSFPFCCWSSRGSLARCVWVVKHGYSELRSAKLPVIMACWKIHHHLVPWFSQRYLHLAPGFSNIPCLMTPEGIHIKNPLITITIIIAGR